MDGFESQLQQLHERGNNPFWKYLTTKKGFSDIRSAFDAGLWCSWSDEVQTRQRDADWWDSCTVDVSTQLEDVDILPAVFDGEWAEEAPRRDIPNALLIYTQLDVTTDSGPEDEEGGIDFDCPREYTTVIYLDDDDIVQIDTVGGYDVGPFTVRPMKANIDEIVNSIAGFIENGSFSFI